MPSQVMAMAVMVRKMAQGDLFLIVTPDGRPWPEDI